MNEGLIAGMIFLLTMAFGAGLAVLGLCSVPFLLSRTDEFHWAPLLVVVAALLAIAIPRTALPLAVPMALVLAALLGYGAAIGPGAKRPTVQRNRRSLDWSYVVLAGARSN